MKLYAWILSLMMMLLKNSAPHFSQNISAPKIVRYTNFESKLVDPRHVEVWLPPGYDSNTADRYPVIYMHDGQNLFNPEDSFIGVVWSPDSAMMNLTVSENVRPAIIVGIWNNGEKRYQEYMPQKAESMKPKNPVVRFFQSFYKPEILSDNYLKFLVTELKPFIDKNYRTESDQPNTFIMGSSMGGLISLYAVCEYPDIFGGAGCISTHWPAGDGVMLDYLNNHLPSPDNHKIYFDYGTETLDSQYEPFQITVDDKMAKSGWNKGKNWLTKKFEGEEHSERAWRKRVHIPIKFMLTKGNETK